MRLVDADALQDKAFGGRKGLVHSSDIDAAPTIDAIPVEWLEEHDGENISDSDGNIYGRRCITVSEALSMWRKEQEAR